MAVTDRISPRLTLRLAWANLVAQTVIILTGGIVRLTGSGLGCSTWPECEPGEFTPVFHEAVTYHPWIEFGNRTLTGVLVVIALAVAVAVWFSPGTRGRTRGVRILGLVPLLGVLAQAVIGGITVLVDLHPAVVGFHFLASALLVAVSAYLVVRLREGDGARRPVVAARGIYDLVVRATPAVFALLTSVVVVLGVITTGSGPHSGDEEVGYRFAFDPAAAARLHGVSVWVFVLAVAAVLHVLYHSRPSSEDLARAFGSARRSWWILAGVTLAQGGIGYLQYFTGLPVPIVAVHLLGSAVLIAAVTFAVLRLRVRPAIR